MKTCKRGHARNYETVRIDWGSHKLVCRECERIRQGAYQKRKRERIARLKAEIRARSSGFKAREENQ